MIKLKSLITEEKLSEILKLKLYLIKIYWNHYITGWGETDPEEKAHFIKLTEENARIAGYKESPAGVKRWITDYVNKLDNYIRLWIILKNKGVFSNTQNNPNIKSEYLCNDFRTTFDLMWEPGPISRDITADLIRLVKYFKSKRRKKLSSNVIYDKNNIKIYHVLFHNDAIKLGKGTKWCITSGDDDGRSSWIENTQGCNFYVLINNNVNNSSQSHKVAIQSFSNEFVGWLANDKHIPNEKVLKLLRKLGVDKNIFKKGEEINSDNTLPPDEYDLAGDEDYQDYQDNQNA